MPSIIHTRYFNPLHRGTVHYLFKSVYVAFLKRDRYVYVVTNMGEYCYGHDH